MKECCPNTPRGDREFQNRLDIADLRQKASRGANRIDFILLLIQVPRLRRDNHIPRPELGLLPIDGAFEPRP